MKREFVAMLGQNTLLQVAADMQELRGCFANIE
jgi:hypothetical protein